MATPTPLEPVKGAGTTLWIYTGVGDPYANPTSNVEWTRLAKIKDLTPGEMTAESYDDTYLDDEDGDWSSTAQGEKSAGEATFTLAWKPGEAGQQNLVQWFHDGTPLVYKISFPNGAVDVFRGWVSSLGKAVPAKEVITRSAKITNTGKPQLAEESRTPVKAVSGVQLDKTTATVAVGSTTALAVTVLPADASDKTYRASSSDPAKVTVTATGNTLTVRGVAAGTADIIVMTNNGAFVASCRITVS